MSEIFSQATHVIAWTGSADLDNARTRAVQFRLKEWGKEELQFRLKKWVQDESLGYAEIEFPLPFLHMCEQPYWTRLWVVQELFLARSVLFSYKDVVWSSDEAARFVHWENAVGWSLVLGSAMWLLNAVCTREVIHRERQALSLAVTLNRWAQLDCENPLDTVYGLQGVVQTDQRISVDYTRTPIALFYEILNLLSLRCSRPNQSIESVATLQLAIKLNITGREHAQLTEHTLANVRRLFGDEVLENKIQDAREGRWCTR
jgi:hypothetical protein